ncbi:AraC family two component transcriptional regulator [Paenibacillus taihuensis]|uniref:AraC family two component transcriptional regulator n=1 Tax=Paenibacillus taihuensis TaxID=1156355 RepID=A0A3D9RM86_9BACL|nr:response regulator [Paenibacillus taihuensis]REE81019.1 AraC family two component transcriptional regulator [Paenibacillus taihuensis]
MRTRTILIVDDEPRSREGMKKMLGAWADLQYELLTAENGFTALGILEETQVDLMITDIRMPEINGLSLVSRMKEADMQRRPAVILISGHAEFEYAQQAIQLSVVNYLLKPISKDKLIAAVEEALEAVQERDRVMLMTKMSDPQLMAVADSEAGLSDPVRSAMQYVDAHIEEAVSLKDVAEHVHLNASYFSTLFKEQSQMTFSEFVARRKLQRAKEMLLRTNLPIAEIAERIGYQTAKYFNKVFKEYEDMSPGQYRSEMKREEENTQK